MSVLICGSYAYDTIMVFHDQFKNHILPDKIHMLNISFLAPEMRREYGGCAGNIAYSLQLLGEQALPMATVGKDFDSYAAWLTSCNIEQKYLTRIEDSFTGQAFITTDMDDNQITAFHPGAMNFSHVNKIDDVSENIQLGIVSPDGREGMLQHAEQFAEQDIPFIFDPGQGMPMFNGEELKHFLDLATWVTVNDYEMQLLQEKTQLTSEQIAQRVQALIVTMGNKGSVIINTKHRIEIPVANPTAVNDPTGCGDAFRSGLLYGLVNKMDWETTGRIASLLGAIKIAEHGTQNHHFSLDSFQQLFKQHFNYTLK